MNARTKHAITAPHNRVIVGRKNFGPTFLIMIVAGNWKITYVVKKTSVIIEYRKPISLRSTAILLQISQNSIIDVIDME